MAGYRNPAKRILDVPAWAPTEDDARLRELTTILGSHRTRQSLLAEAHVTGALSECVASMIEAMDAGDDVAMRRVLHVAATTVVAYYTTEEA